MLHHLTYDNQGENAVLCICLTVVNVGLNWWPLKDVDLAVVTLVHVLQVVLVCLSIALAIRALRKK